MALKEAEIVEVTAGVGFTAGRCDPPTAPPPDTGPKPPSPICLPICAPGPIIPPDIICAPTFGPTSPPPPKPD